MQLKEILYKINIQNLIGHTNLEVTDLCQDSRLVKQHSLYFAIVGTLVDGHQFIDRAIMNGAIAIICNKLPEQLVSGVTYIQTKDTHIALGIGAANFFENPSNEIKVIGITGTNGKTTIATLLFKLFKKLGYKTGLISTVVNIIDDKEYLSTHTTPDAISLQRLLRQMKDNGCEYVFMEVSSHAIHQDRIAGLNFCGAMFCNITHDHLDYHHTFDEYISVKKRLFDNLQEHAFALVNVDDKRGKIMIQNCKAKKHTYSLQEASNFKAKIFENTFEGLLMNVDGVDANFLLIGTFNASNLLAVYSVAILLGMQKMDVLQVLSNITGAAGRFEILRNVKNKSIAIVDYAHTPDALLNVITTINNIKRGTEKLITVIGCGGDRDKAKRPIMASIAAINSEKVILTSDNPRTEDPKIILDEMNAGVPVTRRNKVLTIEDRKEAIKTAVALMGENDIVLVAGKGHESYQEIDGVRYSFDDKAILKEIFENNY
jgi:UDP-N-acetylmuramoyl-L-alanyl-D-glutamate--2,6-diaminopimelate ligase